MRSFEYHARSCDSNVSIMLYEYFCYAQIGLGWQSIIFVYKVSSEDSFEEQKCVILTGSEAVSR